MLDSEVRERLIHSVNGGTHRSVTVRREDVRALLEAPNDQQSSPVSPKLFTPLDAVIAMAVAVSSFGAGWWTHG